MYHIYLHLFYESLVEGRAPADIRDILSMIERVDINHIIAMHNDLLNAYGNAVPRSLVNAFGSQLSKINGKWFTVINSVKSDIRRVKRSRDKYGRDIMTIYTGCCTVKYFDGSVEVRFRGLINGDVTEVNHPLKDELRRMYLGFRVSDGYRSDGYPGMETTQLWQAILFALVTGGRVYVQARGLIIGKQDTGILWRVVSYDMEEKYNSKIKALDEVLRIIKIKDKQLSHVLLAIVLGDGGVETLFKNRDAKIYITCGKDYVNKWRIIINELINILGIDHYYEDEGKTAYSFIFSSSNAKKLVEFVVNGLS